MKIAKLIAFILVLVGALNRGLIGLFNFDLVAWIFGSMTVIARIVYTLVGLAAVFKLIMWGQCCVG
jgi:uncharacterized membrane protein YuzA (DUF378 family)